MNWIKAFLTTAHAEGGRFMPPQGTEIAVEYDNLYAAILWISLIACMILIGGMIYFVVKYRRKTETDKTPYISHNTFLEFLWSFIPLVIFLGAFGWGWAVYHHMRAMPEDALEVHVFGQQWSWSFAYKSGKTSDGEFWVPVNTPVKLLMTSKDVIHSFYIPSMRIKQDVVPGRYSALWFNAEKTGDYQIFCAEYCGTSHSGMAAKMHVVSMEDYEKWIQENDEGLTMAQRGEKLYSGKGCVACHSTDGSTRVGPSWRGLYGRTEEMDDGQKIVADDNYIRESILNPNAKIVKGFKGGLMPVFQGQLSELQLASLVEYIKSLK